MRIEDRMRTNPRLRLPYDPRAGEIWKYYGVIKVTPIVMDKMLVILMTIPVLDKSLELNIYQVHNLPAIPPRARRSCPLSIGEQIFCNRETRNVCYTAYGAIS